MAKRVSGGDGLRRRIADIRARTPQVLHDELYKAAETTRTLVVQDIRTQKISVGYGGKRRGGPGRRKHIPSPPWGPPNSDTGNLAARYGVAMGRTGSTIFALVVAGVLYARHLEYGTTRMLPRPHLLTRFESQSIKLMDRLRSKLTGP